MPGKPSVPFFLATVAGFRGKVDGNFTATGFPGDDFSTNPPKFMGILSSFP